MTVFNYAANTAGVDMTKLDPATLSPNDQVVGSQFDDVLIGFKLNGGLGDDILKGSATGSTVDYSNPGDTGSTGKQGAIVDLTVGQSWGAFGHDTLLNFDHVIGSAGNDWIKSGNSANYVSSQYGDDVVFVHGQQDFVTLGDGNNAVYADSAWGFVTVGTGSNWIEGGDGRNNIYMGKSATTADAPVGNWSNAFGGGGDDTIFAHGLGSYGMHGGNGSDTLLFGAGTNYVDGGAGGDVFAFNPEDKTTVAGQYFAQVFDYEVGIDKIGVPATAEVKDWGPNVGIQYNDAAGHLHTIMLMNVTAQQLTTSNWHAIL